MSGTLEQFAEEYRDNGTRISKFKKYRERFSTSVLLGLLFLIPTLFQQYKSLFQDFPYSDYIYYVPGAVLLCIGLVPYLGKRDMDIGTEDITYYEIASAIKSMRAGDIDATLKHISELEDEAKRSGNGLFLEQTVQRIKSYEDRLEGSQNPEGILDGTFDDFFGSLIGELSEENKMDEILQDISTESDDKFEGSVLLDSVKRVRLDMWSGIAIIAVFGSFFIFNIVGKESGYYAAIISLTVIQILGERRE